MIIILRWRATNQKYYTYIIVLHKNFITMQNQQMSKKCLDLSISPHHIPPPQIFDILIFWHFIYYMKIKFLPFALFWSWLKFSTLCPMKCVWKQWNWSIFACLPFFTSFWGHSTSLCNYLFFTRDYRMMNHISIVCSVQ